MTAPAQCEHGFDCNDVAQVDINTGLSTCCGAYTTIFTDDGSEYCKCCYGTIAGFA